MHVYIFGPRSDEMSEGLRGALNALLFRTGDQSRDFMVVIATNRPGACTPVFKIYVKCKCNCNRDTIKAT